MATRGHDVTSGRVLAEMGRLSALEQNILLIETQERVDKFNHQNQQAINAAIARVL